MKPKSGILAILPALIASALGPFIVPQTSSAAMLVYKHSPPPTLSGWTNELQNRIRINEPPFSSSQYTLDRGDNLPSGMLVYKNLLIGGNEHESWASSTLAAVSVDVSDDRVELSTWAHAGVVGRGDPANKKVVQFINMPGEEAAGRASSFLNAANAIATL